MNTLDRIRAEIGKIILQAKLMGIGIHYIPTNRWKNEPSLHFDRWGATMDMVNPITVNHDALLGTFLFFCPEETMLKIPIPGLNAIYNDYDRRQETQTSTDERGMTACILYGAAIYNIKNPSTDIYP